VSLGGVMYGRGSLRRLSGSLRKRGGDELKGSEGMGHMRDRPPLLDWVTLMFIQLRINKNIFKSMFQVFLKFRKLN
jgi:hypothetical protein